MVLGWRRAFCTSIPKNQDKDSSAIKEKPDPNPSPRLGSRFGGLFSTSNPSTPRLRCKTAVAPPSAAFPGDSAPQSPKLQCRTGNSPRISAPSSPRSPSTFSLLKSSLRISKRCGICVQRVKAGQGTAIFTAECGHSFHFPCVAVHVRKQGSLTCPICSSSWNEMHLLHLTDNIHNQQQKSQLNISSDGRSALKVYNDDEPLSSPTCGTRFNPIPESDDENEEFPGFVVAADVDNVIDSIEVRRRNVEVALLPEAAVVSAGKGGETYAFVLRIRAPAEAARRAAVDMVTVLDVSRGVTAEKIRLMKKAMRMVVSSLSAADRLSIVAFSTTSRRLLALRRMNTAGRRAARRIIDAVVSLDGGAASAADSLKKAAKVIEDRREKNPSACILVFSDGHHRGGAVVSSTTFSDSNIPVHAVSLSALLHAPPEDTFAKCLTTLLSMPIKDLKIQLGFTPGSAPAEIAAVYSNKNKPEYLGSGSSWFRVGDLRSEEEKEFLIELKVPPSYIGAQHRLLSVRCSYNDPTTQQPVYEKERPLLLPRPHTAARDTQLLRCQFIAARAVAESRRLIERNDINGARHILSSGRALILQTGSGLDSEFHQGLEAELNELSWKRKVQLQNAAPRTRAAQMEEKAEPLTPTSAWRAAERLAKVAIMRKSLNRVSDLHGFEDARF